MGFCKLGWRHDPDEAGDIEAVNIVEYSLPVELAFLALVLLAFPSPSEGINSALPEETVMFSPEALVRKADSPQDPLPSPPLLLDL